MKKIAGYIIAVVFVAISSLVFADSPIIVSDEGAKVGAEGHASLNNDVVTTKSTINNYSSWINYEQRINEDTNDGTVSGINRRSMAKDNKDLQRRFEVVNARRLAGDFARNPLIKALDDNIPGVPIPVSPINNSLNAYTDTDDVFQVPMSAGQTITVSFSGASGTDFDVILFPPGSTNVGTSSGVAGSQGASYPESFSYTATSSGTYYLDIYSYTGSGTYTLTYSLGAGGGGVDDNIPGVPIPVSPINNSLNAYTDTDDVFQVPMSAGQTITVSFSGASGTDFDVILFPPGSTNVGTSSGVAGSQGASYPESFSYTATSSGTYYLDIYSYTGSGTYTLTYSLGAPLPPEPPSGTGKNKHALLIGVEDYPGTSADLNYTVDDVVDVREALMTNSGFDANDIYTLTDGHATRANIQSAITGWLDSLESPGDTVVIYYSGHGTNVPDITPYDEADGLDETIYVYDGNIRDDELGSWIGSLESTKIVIGIDSCFSGGFLKTLDEPNRDSKFIESGNSGRVNNSDGFTKDINRTGIITLTASNDTEYSGEYGSLQNGLFTYYFVEAMKTWGADYNSSGLVSAEEIYQYLLPRVVAYDPTQNPQIYDGVNGQLDLANPSGMTSASPIKEITAFTIPGQIGTTNIDQGSHTIALTMPYGTNVTALVPSITINGASVSPASGVARNFTAPQTYSVTAEDTSIQDYTVTVTVALNPAKAVTGFTIPGQVGATTIDEGAHTISLTMPYGTDVTALVPTITHTGALVNPASGVAHNFTNPSTYIVTAENASTQAYTVTVTIASGPVKSYYWTWYDNIYARNWVLMANPASARESLSFDLSIGNQKLDLSAFALKGAACPAGKCSTGEVPPGMTMAPIYPGLMAGPVKVSSNTGAKAVVSQRILVGNSFDEVLGTEASKLSDHFYWTWYDMNSPGFKNWILVANPSTTETIRATVSFTNQDDGQLIHLESLDIAPGANWNPTFPGKMGGPVEVKAYKNDSIWENDPRPVMASQRVLSNYDQAFNEMPGIAANELSNHYMWTWYDQKSPGYKNWVLIANPSGSPVTYQVKIAGKLMDLGGGRTTDTIPARGKAAPTFPDQMDGPVEVIASGNVIASQRVIAGPSFEEVAGYPKSALANNYHWTWYDMQSSGAANWVLIANPTDTTITYEIKIPGLNPSTPGATGTISPFSRVAPTFPGMMNGPVEVTATGKVMVSQRVTWNGYFNEVLGTVLE